ncbi:uncharacterized protein FTOL_02547 [Fusarium torulosum]|uniref:Ankyrin n=1 Tax=Fusarium torulosum TaxID=33205 RepID=A0AAE8M2Z0_9HYPO|nr:uncharacterized protein FTOL_02547 [Fusarium torulosum]
MLRRSARLPEASYLLTTGDGCWGTPLHVAIYLDNIEAVNLLLQTGVDVAANSPVHKQRLSPLAFVAQPIILTAARHINLVGALKVLLEKRANPNATDHRGKTALHFLGSPAAIHQSGPIVRINRTGVRLLLGHGASVLQGDDESGATLLHAAAFGADLNMLQLYLSSCPAEETRQTLRSKNKYGETLLHYAAAGAKSDIAELLISQGLDVNGTNTNGWTPLHCALTPASHGSQLNGLAKSIFDALKLA